MDIFGKRSSPGTTKKTSFQQELSAKMRERKSQGLAADLTSDEAIDSDDELMAGFQQTSRPSPAQRTNSGSPWNQSKAPVERQTPPQQSKPSFLKSSQPDKRKTAKPQNELDRLLMDDEAVSPKSQEKKPWQPPTFKDFSSKENTQANRMSPSLREGQQEVGNRNNRPMFGSGRSTPQSGQRTPMAEVDEEDSDEDLAGAYQKTLMRTHSPAGSRQGQKSPFDMSRQTSVQDNYGMQHKNSQNGREATKGLDAVFGRKSPKDVLVREESSSRKSPKPEAADQFDRRTPKQESSDSFGRKSPKEPSFDPFGRKSPKEPSSDPFGRKSPKEPSSDLFGRKSPKEPSSDPFGRKSPKEPSSDPFGRKSTKDQPSDLYSREGSKAQSEKTNPFGRKSPKQEKTLDEMFGRQATIGSRQSPQVDRHENMRGQRQAPVPQRRGGGHTTSFQETEEEHGMSSGYPHSRQPEQTLRKGSYMSSLLDDEEQNPEKQTRAGTRNSYLNNLLGDDSDEETQKPAPTNRRTSYMDSLLADEPEERQPRPRQRVSHADRGTRNQGSSQGKPLADENEERDSSLCRDVDKDPQMVERLEKEREARKSESRKGAKTNAQKTSILIDEVADAQNPSAMTFIEPQSGVDNRSSTIVKPKPRKSVTTANKVDSDSSELSFESAADIRKYIYDEWKNKKTTMTKKQIVEKKKLEKEAEEKRKKEEQDKLLEKEAVYRTWKEKKDEELRHKIRVAKRAEKLKEEEQKKLVEKKIESELVLKGWKENKDDQIKINERKKKKEQIRKMTEEQELKETKKKDAESAFNGWKKRKDVGLKGTIREQKLQMKQQEQLSKIEARRQEEEAEKLYEKWLENKEKQKEREKNKKKMLQQSQLYDDEPRPAWSPANTTIPYRR